MPPERIQRAIAAHARSFSALYGDEAVTPKFHYGCTHMVQQLSRLGFLPACFVLERKHKVAKKFGDHVVNTSAEWDRGCMRDVTACHLAAVQRCHAQAWANEARLVNPRVPRSKMLMGIKHDLQLGPADSVEVSREMRVSAFERCMQGDVVLVGSADEPRLIGQVHLHAEVNGCAVSLIRQWGIVRRARRHWKCQESDRDFLVFAEDITCPLIWGGNKLRTVLKPFRS